MEHDGAMAEQMEKGDPDLDPVWGLLLGAAEEKVQMETPEIRVPCSAPSNVPAVPPSFEEDTEGTDVPQGFEVKSGPTGPISNVVDKAEVLPQMFPLNKEANVTIKYSEVPGCDAFVLDDVLTEEECQSLIHHADGLWTFWENDPSRPRISFRNAHTIEVTHDQLAERIWQRVSEFVRPEVQLSEDDPRFEIDIQGTWKPYAVNPKLLLSRYLEGGHFSPHTDGTTVIDFNRRTFYSCVLFLNSSAWGGHTRLYADEQMGKELQKDDAGRLTGDPSLILSQVEPKPGRMLVFYHRLMHEGVPAAEKYIIRTDILYRREVELCTAPEDVKAFELYQKAQLLAEEGDCKGAAELFRRAFKESEALREIYKM
eukprot:Skav204791  [mRNA]  locus=scaffold763:363850:364956:+ [translate_table: standard]